MDITAVLKGHNHSKCEYNNEIKNLFISDDGK